MLLTAAMGNIDFSPLEALLVEGDDVFAANGFRESVRFGRAGFGQRRSQTTADTELPCPRPYPRIHVGWVALQPDRYADSAPGVNSTGIVR
jgi:hypothetical protein